jgi:hypothetical protein
MATAGSSSTARRSRSGRESPEVRSPGTAQGSWVRHATEFRPHVQEPRSDAAESALRGRVLMPKWNIDRCGDFEPLVSEAIFDRVQARLTGHLGRRAPHAKDHPDFTLRRFVKCARCGQQGLTGCWVRRRARRYGYYKCRLCGPSALVSPRGHLASPTGFEDKTPATAPMLARLKSTPVQAGLGARGAGRGFADGTPAPEVEGVTARLIGYGKLRVARPGRTRLVPDLCLDRSRNPYNWRT